MMKRDQAFQILARHFPDGIVVPVFQAAFDWMAIRPHPLNYLCTGAMGQASSHALGLALGCPEHKVVVLDGDGSLLMNLGSLVTIASVAPTNLVHFVCSNGLYEVNGRYPIPGASDVDFSLLAKAAGFRRTYEFSELDTFEQGVDDVLAGDGPVFATLNLEQGAAYDHDFPALHSAESRTAFRTALEQLMN
jgi:sulfopyruvate decarboxylase subunit beta